MPLSQLTMAQAQQNQATNYNAVANVPANTAAGSSLGAIFNANAALFMAAQGEIAYVYAVARLLTSTGTDVDSFINAFGLTRNAAAASSGTVTFSAASTVTTGTIFIPNGTVVKTAAGTVFTVIADTTQLAYSAALQGYSISTGNSSCNATVQAQIPGSASNVLANTINIITSSSGAPAPAGVATVNNTAAFTNGADAETDSAFIARFQAFINGRWATDGSVASAILGTQAGLTYEIGDGIDQNGNSVPNQFTVIVGVLNTGTSTSTAVINAVQNAVMAIKPAGVPFNVLSPAIISINANVTIQLVPGSDPTATQNAAQTAFNNYINNIGLVNTFITSTGQVSTSGTNVSYAKVIATLLAVTGVNNVTNVTLNNGTVDIPIPWGSMAGAGSWVSTAS